MGRPSEIQNCQFIYQCPKTWDRLTATDDPKVRFCDQCYEQVYWVTTEPELATHSAQRHCVAIPNLSPDHPEYTGEIMIGQVTHVNDSDFDAFNPEKQKPPRKKDRSS